ncbi:hypothetical protein [Chromobacterium sphagni]|nr:hypothetical protein [Chromobacterium sphagni]
MSLLRRGLKRLLAWWWQGMTLHARQACRDEVEALERIRNQAGERR